jgi:tetratricopeptide (TPR) repeat protein
MINLVVSLALGIAVAVAVRLFGFPWYAGVIPGTIVFIGVFVVLGRRIFLQLQKTMGAVQAELQSLPPNQKEQKLRVDKVVKMLEGALPLGRWQFLVESEIQGQIGMIKFMFKDIPGAEAAFKKAGSRNYLARAMQASLYYQRKEYGPMRQAFEEGVKAGKKEGLIWAAYAWCLLQIKERDQALRVMARAVEANPSDEKLKAGLTALQNDKRLKMKPWEPMWFQLGLETPVQQQPMFAMRGARGRMR